MAYSCWPGKKSRDNFWSGENAPSEELPLEIRSAVLKIQDCLGPDRKIPDLCMEVVNDLLLSFDNPESCALCSTAIIKSGISQVFYGAPHEKDSNPGIHLSEINKKAKPQIEIYGGFMKNKFGEQIKRRRCQAQTVADQNESNIPHEKIIRDFGDVLLKKSKIGQFDDGIGAFVNRDFKKGEVVIKWNLKALSEAEYNNLPEYEKENFCHQRNGIRWLYPDPERHVNRFDSPNVIPDFEQQANVALRDIRKDEELSIANNTVEDF